MSNTENKKEKEMIKESEIKLNDPTMEKVRNIKNNRLPIEGVSDRQVAYGQNRRDDKLSQAEFVYTSIKKSLKADLPEHLQGMPSRVDQIYIDYVTETCNEPSAKHHIEDTVSAQVEIKSRIEAEIKKLIDAASK